MDVIQIDALQSLAQIEIDTQISTAKAYPRDIKKFFADAKEMATLTPEIAESCGYAKPQKMKDEITGEYYDGFITGPSVRLAEILISCYGNLRSGTRIIANDGKKITAQARVHDLEKNTAHEANLDRSIVTKLGYTFAEHMQVTTGNAAASIALRNAVFKVIPAAYVQPIYEAAMAAAKPKDDEMPAKRKAAIDYFVSMGVSVEEILRVMRVKDVTEIGPERLSILRGMASAIKNGESTVAEMFTQPGTKAEQPVNPEADRITQMVADCKTIQHLATLADQLADTQHEQYAELFTTREAELNAK